MSCAARPSEVIDPMSFANTVVIVVDQVLTAQGSPSTQNDNIQIVIAPALAQPDILVYSFRIGAKIFSKATESLKTPIFTSLA
jgi:hypothetical protein